MESSEHPTPILADVDLICDNCQCEITIGQDYFYDENREETLCELCQSNRAGNT